MRHRGAGEHVMNGVFEIVNSGRRTRFPDVHIAIVDSSVVLETPRPIEHRGFGRDGDVSLRDKLMLRVAERCSRKAILRNVISDPGYALGPVRVHEPEIDTVGGELVSDARQLRCVAIGYGTVGTNK